jgi:hypothetical protein
VAGDKPAVVESSCQVSISGSHNGGTGKGCNTIEPICQMIRSAADCSGYLPTGEPELGQLRERFPPNLPVLSCKSFNTGVIFVP